MRHVPTPLTWWLHPFLVAAFPVLFLFSQNIGEQLSVDPLWMPLGVVLGIALAGVLMALLARVIFGVGRARLTLLVSLVILLALTYGHVWNLVGETLHLHRWLLIAWGLIGLIGAVVISRLGAGAIGRLTSGVTVVAGILVVINLVPIGGLVLRPSGTVVGGEDATGGNAGEGREIWYLVFDRYAGAPALEEIYGFDNSPFLDELRKRGFVVAEHASANYLKTAHSLASSLDMAELDADALRAEASAPDDWTPLYRRLQGSHAVERFLHDRGYRYVHLGLRRGATYANSAADVTYLYGDTTEFSAVLADTTILAALENVLGDAAPIGTTELYARQTLFQLEELDRIAAAPADRRFVFGHLLLPHPPYVYNADGSRVTPAQSAARTADEAYLQQVEFANARMLELVDRLQQRPRDEWPIIVLAADEGPFPDRYAENELDFAWTDATDAELLEKFSILMAVLPPGGDAAALRDAGFHDSLTPDNLFRVIFDAAFDADLELLPERNWIFTDQRHIYDFVDVTDRVQAVIGGRSAGLR